MKTMNLSGTQTLKLVASTGMLLGVLLQGGAAPSHHPPGKPAIAPLISARYPNDTDGDHIDDALTERAQRALALERAAAAGPEKSRSKALLNESVNVELIFKEPVTQKEMDAFLVLGGEITYVYQAVSYGWNGRIPLGKVAAVPATMGATLALLDQPKGGEVQLNVATLTGRVRPVWAPGFAGNTFGFAGSTNITIAILDTGVDESHADLTGRCVFWHDYTSSNYVNPIDINGHGSHSAGIAVGTGLSGGSETGTLGITAYRNISANNNGTFIVDGMDLPTNSVNITATAQWNGGSAGGTRLRWLQRFRNDPPNIWSEVSSLVGTPPLTLTLTMSGQANRVYCPTLLQSNGISDYVINSQIANHPGVGDGFNKLRGVAPGCNWAAAKIADDAGRLTWDDVSAAVDDLVANRVLYNIKVMNVSAGGTLSGSLRQKINSAVHNGIVMALGAGNSAVNRDYGPGVGTNFVTEPGRAAMGLTVGASSSINQLTHYSRQGFFSPNSTAGQEEDYKPDLLAPGGSIYQAQMTSTDSNTGDGPALSDQQTNDYRQLYGTSMSIPFAAGCAALVIEALEQTGVVWDFNSSQHARFVKMVLCATASESNKNREGTTALTAPMLQRASSITNGAEVLPPGKDLAEGYGMVNPDAAIEAVSLTLTHGVTNSAVFGSAPSDRRAWARTVRLVAGELVSVNLAVPPSGDFDLYLYSYTPGAYGTPVMLASSTQSGGAVAETIHHLAASDGSALLVVKRVAGSGAFALTAASASIPQPIIFLGPTIPNSFIFSFNTVIGVSYKVEFKDSLEAPNWQVLQTIPGDGTLKTISDASSAVSQRFYRLSLF